MLVGCEGAAHTVTVKVRIPDLSGDPAPTPGVPVTAAPFDRDSLLRALEGPNAGVLPARAALDSLFALYRPAFLDFFMATRQRDSLRSQGAKSDALARADAAFERARQALTATRAQLDQPIDSLRAVVRRWEDSTYARFSDLADSLRDASGQTLITDTTDASGVVQLRLPSTPSGWWITTSSWNVNDPNSLWYWNVPVTGDTIVLDQASGALKARY